jgi:hypothetical protein
MHNNQPLSVGCNQGILLISLDAVVKIRILFVLEDTACEIFSISNIESNPGYAVCS